MLSREEVVKRILQLPASQQAKAASLALKVYGQSGQHNSFYTKYKDSPVRYATEVLGVRWWHKQIEVAEAIIQYPKVLVKASHDVGKTFIAAGLASWHYDCFNPGITLTTAPSLKQVVGVTWKEIRSQRKGRGMLPRSPRIESLLPSGELDPNHVAFGVTARDNNAFQGHHENHLFIIFEEATGIREEFWEAAEGMLSSGDDNRWLCILNPTDTASTAYNQEISGDFYVITISALDHPNIEAQLHGLPKPFPKAISLTWIEKRIAEWCTPVDAKDAKAADFCWPPLDFCKAKGIEPQWYRPGPLFEGRVLGRWPSGAIGSVWSEALWIAACQPKLDLQSDMKNHPPEIGVDVAREGDDYSSFHVRRGGVSLMHETHNGWTTDQTAGRTKQLCDRFGQECGVEGKKVLAKIDDDGVGGGVVDQRGSYNFVGIGAGTKAANAEGYPNRRSELWFTTASRADENRIDFSLLPKDMLTTIRLQAMAPKWKVDGEGRRVVEDKKITKKRIKRSPDDMDAVNLAYAGNIKRFIKLIG